MFKLGGKKLFVLCLLVKNVSAVYSTDSIPVRMVYFYLLLGYFTKKWDGLKIKCHANSHRAMFKLGGKKIFVLCLLVKNMSAVYSADR